MCVGANLPLLWETMMIPNLTSSHGYIPLQPELPPVQLMLYNKGSHKWEKKNDAAYTRACHWLGIHSEQNDVSRRTGLEGQGPSMDAIEPKL